MQLVMSHVGTDFDGLASMVLAQKLYPGAQLVFPGPMCSGVKEFYDLHKRRFPALALKDALAVKPSRIIVVDTRTPSRLGDFRQWVQDSEVELHIYDHHPPTAESVKGDQEWVEPVGAAATLLVERCRERGLEIELETASLALLAIHEETGSFRYSSSTARDLSAAAYLMECGANLEVVTNFLKDPLTDEQRELLEDFLRHGEVYQGTAGRLFVCHAKRLSSVYGLGGLASRILDVQGTDAVCAVLEVEGEGTSVAGRAGSDVFDLADWMSHWGGGGHRRAAAASKISLGAAEVAKQLAGFLQTGQKRVLTAGDIMSRELFTIDWACTVEKASRDLQARGYHSACVLDAEGRLLGLVSRPDLTRALDHDLGHAPARSVMTHKVVSVAMDDTLEQVRRVVVERNVGTLPVIENGELVGLVTRTDLLRQLYQESEQDAWQRAGQGPIFDLTGIEEPKLSRLRTAARLAAEKKVRLYVVGGFVRDLLLGRQSDDLDLVVEGDAIALAFALKEELGGKVISHEKYLTACVKFSDGDKLDIATARREVYVRPAALPEVAESKLKSDLYRRDFTVNALALRLSDSLQATLIDFFGGRQDLEAKKVRILHNHSFLDDPTRILRAVRFEQRLGFDIEPHSRQLIQSALDADIFALAHGERMAEEFRLSLSESDPVKVLSRLEKLKVLRAIHPEISFKQRPQERAKRAVKLMERFPNLVPADKRWLVPLMMLGLELSDEAKGFLAQRFGWRIAIWPFPINYALGQISRKPLRPSEVAAILDQLPGTQVAVLGGIANNTTFEERLVHYVERTRDMSPLLRGQEIIAHGIEPGPQVARWKERAYAAQRDEQFMDLQGAREWLQGELETASKM